MKGIGGNVHATLQTCGKQKNDIGEMVNVWTDAADLCGWLDFLSGGTEYMTFHAKVQQSTHVFLCDYVPLPASISAQNSRMVIEGKYYDVTLMDNPMGLRGESQLEFYLKYTGGGQDGT